MDVDDEEEDGRVDAADLTLLLLPDLGPSINTSSSCTILAVLASRPAAINISSRDRPPLVRVDDVYADVDTGATAAARAPLAMPLLPLLGLDGNVPMDRKKSKAAARLPSLLPS
jgi:hypothetical protein